MRVVPVSAAPNQSFTATIDAVRWGLALHDLRGATSVTVSRDGVTMLENTRALAGEAIIPYAYLQTGNFIFITGNAELPYYREFGVSQFLVYLSANEIAAIEANPPTVDELLPFEPSYLLDNNGFYLTTDNGELLTDD